MSQKTFGNEEDNSDDENDRPDFNRSKSLSSFRDPSNGHTNKITDDDILEEFLNRFVMFSTAKFRVLDVKAIFFSLPKKFNVTNLDRAALYNFTLL